MASLTAIGFYKHSCDKLRKRITIGEFAPWAVNLCSVMLPKIVHTIWWWHIFKEKIIAFHQSDQRSHLGQQSFNRFQKVFVPILQFPVYTFPRVTDSILDIALIQRFISFLFIFFVCVCVKLINFVFSCQEVEFSVTNVQIHGGYVLHVGAIEGTLRVGDQMKCQIDEVCILHNIWTQ